MVEMAEWLLKSPCITLPQAGLVDLPHVILSSGPPALVESCPMTCRAQGAPLSKTRCRLGLQHSLQVLAKIHLEGRS